MNYFHSPATNKNKPSLTFFSYRHRRMEAVRLRKENQIYSADEKWVTISIQQNGVRPLIWFMFMYYTGTDWCVFSLGRFPCQQSSLSLLAIKHKGEEMSLSKDKNYDLIYLWTNPISCTVVERKPWKILAFRYCASSMT